MNDLLIRPSVSIPAAALSFSYARSGGKGGQNVNKVSTKVELKVDVAQIRCPSRLRERMLRTLSRMMDAEGMLRITSQESRSQWQNRQTALEKLERLVHKATEPVTVRVATAPTPGSRHRRVERKKKAGAKKQLRSLRFSGGDE